MTQWYKVTYQHKNDTTKTLAQEFCIQYKKYDKEETLPILRNIIIDDLNALDNEYYLTSITEI